MNEYEWHQQSKNMEKKFYRIEYGSGLGFRSDYVAATSDLDAITVLHDQRPEIGSIQDISEVSLKEFENNSLKKANLHRWNAYLNKVSKKLKH